MTFQTSYHHTLYSISLVLIPTSITTTTNITITITITITTNITITITTTIYLFGFGFVEVAFNPIRSFGPLSTSSTVDHSKTHHLTITNYH